ncbi:MAG: hypothetical protein WAW96_09765, partial [Alphaproteobacteria bacterium]
SRIMPLSYLTILLLPMVAVLGAASSAFAEPELRRLPISFDQLAAHLPIEHRLVLRKTHRPSHKAARTQDTSETLARAANLLTVSGYTDIKALHTEGDHVAAVVKQNDETQNLIVTKEGAVAAGDTAAIGPGVVTPTASDASSPTASASATSDAPAPAPESTPPAPAPDTASVAAFATNEAQAQVQAAAAVGSTSDAARPGALSASSSTP